MSRKNHAHQLINRTHVHQRHPQHQSGIFWAQARCIYFQATDHDLHHSDRASGDRSALRALQISDHLRPLLLVNRGRVLDAAVGPLCSRIDQFLAAHLFYIAAFSYEGGRAFSAWQAIPFLIYGSLMLRILLPSLGKMKLPVMLYMLVILIMGWRALSRMLETQAEGSALALLGALMFIASDSILALDWFKGHFHSAPFLILSTYFIAQWLIALSI